MRQHIRASDADRILHRGRQTLRELGKTLAEQAASRCADTTDEAEAKRILEEEVTEMLRAVNALEAAILAEIAAASCDGGES